MHYLINVRLLYVCRIHLGLLLLLLFQSAKVAAEEPPSWIKSFVRTYDGQQFCVPPGSQSQDFSDVISRYKKAHPELGDKIGGQAMLDAFKDTFPRPATSVTSKSITFWVAPQDDYKSIDTSQSLAIIKKLAATVGHENDELIADIQRNPGNYQPPVFFSLTRVLYDQGRTDDAIFRLSAARLRGNFDTLRCADITAKSAVQAMMRIIPPSLPRAQFDDLPKLRRLVNEAIRWDENTPHNYDHRWINLHGMGAVTGGLGVPTKKEPMSVPREEWPALAAKTRADYVASLDSAIQELQGSSKK